MNLYEEKVKRMGDLELFLECLKHARLMEEDMNTLEHYPIDHRVRAHVAFSEGISRDSMSEYRDIFNTAVKVITIL